MCDTDPSLSDAYADVRDDNSDTDWLVAGYADKKTITAQGTGSGGVSELVAQFADDQAQFAYLRVTAGDEESRRTKFVFITWVGEGVKALAKAKVSVHKASVKQVVRDFGVEMHATERNEVSEDEIMKRVIAAMGANYMGQSSQ